MSNNKQPTAVEWFNSKIKQLEFWVETRQITWKEYHKEKDKLIDQAKEMEKEKAIKLYIDYENYLHEEFKHQNGGQAVILSFREFYEQTYGGGEQ